MDGNLISSIVYENGVVNTLNDKFVILLIADGGDGEIIASSACIDNTGGNEQYLLGKKINWDRDRKSIIIDNFTYEETRSGTDLGDTNRYASYFEIVKLNIGDIVELIEPAYEGSEEKYKWSKFNTVVKPNDEDIIFKGSLNEPLQIMANNNFIFHRFEIRFSEIQDVQ